MPASLYEARRCDGSSSAPLDLDGTAAGWQAPPRAPSPAKSCVSF
jgi:hypothetical protein